MIEFVVLTLFPEMIEEAVSHSMLGRAIENQLLKVTCVDIRDFSTNKHRHVDDYPYGGGPGMVMTPEPIFGAVKKAKEILEDSEAPVYFMSPGGETFSQEKAKSLAITSKMILLCGHYEGIDQRVIDELVTEEISVGDYILTGGELPALVIIDAVSRLRDDVLQNEESAVEESFEGDLLEHPQYTRPADFNGLEVPKILLSGNHGKIKKWRDEKAIERTKQQRPDLYKKYKEKRK